MPTSETAKDITLPHSQETLRRVKENDETLKNLWIGGTVSKSRQNNQPTIIAHTQSTRKTLNSRDGVFSPSDDSEFSSLSAYIAKSTNLTTLLNVDGRTGLDVECLWRNSSTHKLTLTCGGRDISEDAICDILQVYQHKNVI